MQLIGFLNSFSTIPEPPEGRQGEGGEFYHPLISHIKCIEDTSTCLHVQSIKTALHHHRPHAFDCLHCSIRKQMAPLPIRELKFYSMVIVFRYIPSLCRSPFDLSCPLTITAIPLRINREGAIRLHDAVHRCLANPMYVICTAVCVVFPTKYRPAALHVRAHYW